MTTLQLLGYISAALLLQMAVGLGIAFRRLRLKAHEPAARDAVAAPPAAAGAWPGWREFRVVRRAFEDAARSQCSFYLQPVDGAPLPAFLPGQFLTFAVPAREGVVPSTLTRCYSLSDRPDPAAYRVTIKRAVPPPGRPELPPGASSSHFHDRVHEGDVLRVKAPAGRFFIDTTDASVPAVLVAGGIGITPMMSMLRWCVSEQPQRAVHLFYGVRNSADHAFKGVLELLARTHPAFQLHMVYSDPQPGDVLGQDHQHTGRVDLELIRRCLPHGQHQFYVCGPPPMMQSLVPALREWGVREQDIHFEAFGPATVRPAGPVSNEPLPATATTLDVHLRRSGRTLVWDGQDANLLVFAERHLVAVESGCRSGSCGSCETRLVSGSVRYAERPDHEVAPGHCLLCVATPQTALELEI
ncbi:MAG: 2Fe-2S iron-sulfur cluster binding domain-containing protein [Hydrogenophaga sp.]|nr:2Fe-2S iron-sulfur cluster binding domain-containing protein [Hydrogenophaga sp.]